MCIYNAYAKCTADLNYNCSHTENPSLVNFWSIDLEVKFQNTNIAIKQGRPLLQGHYPAEFSTNPRFILNNVTRTNRKTGIIAFACQRKCEDILSKTALFNEAHTKELNCKWCDLFYRIRKSVAHNTIKHTWTS